MSVPDPDDQKPRDVLGLYEVRESHGVVEWKSKVKAVMVKAQKGVEEGWTARRLGLEDELGSAGMGATGKVRCWESYRLHQPLACLASSGRIQTVWALRLLALLALVTSCIPLNPGPPCSPGSEGEPWLCQHWGGERRKASMVIPALVLGAL